MSSTFDRAALQQLFQYAMSLTVNHHDAQELVQTALELYLIQLRKGQQIESKVAYVRTLIRHRFIDLCRRNQRWQYEALDEQLSHNISPVDLEQWVYDSELLAQIWAELPPIDRDILYHWAELGYTIEEVATHLNMPKGTVLSRIHRLRKRCVAMQPELVHEG